MKLIPLILVLAPLLQAPAPAVAGEVLDAVRERAVLRCGVSEGW